MSDMSGASEVQPLVDFMENAYRRYAVLTIQDRALPDGRDGLKPVQRRILLAMSLMGLVHNHAYRKSARVVGEVLGKYHPHGDASVYDAMVRLAQDFSMRYPLVDGQGNFGSIDGDFAAAMRYTEARLTELGEYMLANLKEDTVDWRPNFDGSQDEPMVLPARFPNLIVNGSSGIAVGMSTSILPHNLGEICEAAIYMAGKWRGRSKVKVDELMKIVPGPDFPTGGIVYRYRVNGEEGAEDMIRRAYEIGNATLVCQAKADIGDIGGGKSEIVITELPYQVQKGTVLERVVVARDKIPGLTDVRDESDYTGMRIVFEVARGHDPQDVLEALFTHTQLRTSLSHNALALIRDNGRAAPQYLNLRDMLERFVFHRLEVITRRSRYALGRAEKRLHIVRGLLKALDRIDEVIDIIKRSRTTETAKGNLRRKLSLSNEQAQAILDMPLRRLASLERRKLDDERKALTARVRELKAILKSERKRLAIVIEETREISDRFADPRRTVIIDDKEGHQAQVTVADLVVPTEPQLVVLSLDGTVQRVDAKGYRDSAGAGQPTARAVRLPLQKMPVDPDATVLLITNQGRMWRGNVGRLPMKASPADFGLGRREQVVACAVAEPGKSLVIGTAQGNVKRVKVEDLSGAEASWVTAVGLTGKDDRVLFAGVVADDADVVFFTRGGEKVDPKVIRFVAGSVNPQATPAARGVAGIRMSAGAPLVGGSVLDRGASKQKRYVVVLTEKGYCKRVDLGEFPVQGRGGGQGVLTLKRNRYSGLVVGAAVCGARDSVDVYSERGRRLRLKVSSIEESNRPGRGSDLIAAYGKGGELFGGDPLGGVVMS